MTREQQIRDLGTVARELGQLRSELLEKVPFGKELEATRYDLERVAAPVVAMMGGASAGKSTLINTFCNAAELLPTSPVPTTLIPIRLRGGKARETLIGTSQGAIERQVPPAVLRDLITQPEEDARYLVMQAPEAKGIPWEWLDTPGTNSESKKDRWPFPYPPTLADICVFVSPATQALSLGDVQQLLWLAEAFPKGHLIIAISRIDLLPPEQLAVVKNYVAKAVLEVFPASPPEVFHISTTSPSGITELRDHLAERVYDIQTYRLAYEMKSFGKLLVDVKKIMDLKAFAGVRIETIEAAQERVTADLQAGVLDITRAVPRFAEEILAIQAGRLPEKQRKLATEFHAQLVAKIQNGIDELGKRLNQTFIQAIQKDLKDRSVAATLNEKFSELFQLGSPEFFDARGAAMGAAVGVGLAAAIGLALPIVGTALLGAALASSAAGGMLGGLFGSGTTIATVEEFRERIVRPSVTQAQNGLSNASQEAVNHVAQFCRSILLATQMFARKDSKDRSIEQMVDAVMTTQRAMKPLRAKFESITEPPSQVPS